MKIATRVVMLAGAIIATACVSPAHAQLGGLMKKPGGESSQTTSAMSISDWLKMANDAKTLLDNSSSLLLTAVASQAEIDKINELRKAAAEAKDDKAKKEIQLKIESETNAALKAADYDKAAAGLAAEKNAAKVANVGNAAYNFVLGVLKDKELLDTANGVMDGAKSNPMALKDVGKVKDVVSSISAQMAAMSAIMTNLPKLGKVAKVNLPTSSKDSPKEVKF